MNIAPIVALIRRSRAPLGDLLTSFVTGLQQKGGLAILADNAPLLVLGASHAPHFLLPEGQGLLWGHVFDRITWQRVAGANAIRGSTATETFSGRYWGSYLKLSVDDRGVEVARDPSGGIPCYHATIDDTEIFTSRPELLFDADLLRPGIDWTILTQAIAYRDLRPERTALRGVSELLPGNAATVSRDGVRTHCFWSPWAFVRPVENQSVDDAADLVRRVAASCIGAWARCFDRPLVEVSGGLDSSIVAAGVTAANKHANLVSFASARGDPDEIPYARAMAAHLGLELHVLRADIRLIDLLQSQARDLPRPNARAFAQALDCQLGETAAALGADAFFSGGGGDNVFGYLQSVLPVIDRLRSEGLGRGVVETIGDVASLTGVSIWAVGKHSVQRTFRRRAPHRWTFAPRWLSIDAAAALPFPAGHPWLSIPDDVPPGKRVHGHALITIQNHLEGFGRLHMAPVISPLLSQPLVEACMAIPTWFWCRGGENRAVARRAFAGALPLMVRARQTKGAFDSYCAQIFEANRPMLSMMLLEGELASHGVVDRGAIRETLSAPAVSRQDMLGLLNLIDVEAWAMAWSSRLR